MQNSTNYENTNPVTDLIPLEELKEIEQIFNMGLNALAAALNTEEVKAIIQATTSAMGTLNSTLSSVGIAIDEYLASSGTNEILTCLNDIKTGIEKLDKSFWQSVGENALGGGAAVCLGIKGVVLKRHISFLEEFNEG